MQCKVIMKTKTELLAELEQAQKRIAELEKTLVGKKRDSKTTRVQPKVSDTSSGQDDSINQMLLKLRDVFWVASLDGATVLEVSPAFKELYGCTTDEFRANPNLRLEMVHPDDRAVAEASMDELTKTGHSETEYRIQHTDGSVRWILDRKSFIYDKQGNPVQIGGIASDITSRKKAEQELLESESRFAKAFMSSPFGTVLLDLPGQKIRDINPAGLEIWGFTREEVIGKTTLDLNIVVNPQQREEIWAEAAKSGKLSNLETRMRRKDGQFRDLILSAETIEINGLTYLLILFVDNTQRKQAEQMILASETLLRQVLESTQDSVFAINRNYQLLINNQQHQQVLVETRGNPLCVGESVLPLDYPAEMLDLWRGLYDRAFDGEDFKWETEWTYTDGQQHVIEVTFSPLLDTTGNITGALVVIHDITERKQAADALQQERTLLHTLIDSQPDCVFLKDTQSRFLIANQATAELMGVTSPDALLGKTDFDFYPMEEAQRYFDSEQRIIQSGESQVGLEYWQYDSDRNICWVVGTKLALRDAQEQVIGLIGIQRDITDLRQSQEKFRTVADTIGEVFWIYDNQQGKIEYISPGYQTIWGRTPNSLYEDNKQYIEAILPEDRSLMFAALERQAGGEKTEMEYRILHTDGSIRWILDRSTPVFNDTGVVIRTTGIATDITKRKQAEVQLNQRVEDLALINKLNDAVNHGESLIQITELLAQDAKTLFGSQSASLYLLDSEKKRLLLQHYTMPRERVAKLELLIGRTVPQIDLPVGGDDHFSRSLESDDGFLITGFAEVCAWLADFSNTSFLPVKVRPIIRKIIPAAVKLLNINSIVTIPLKAGDELMGVIEFVAEGEFAEGVLERLRNVRHQLAEVVLRKRTEQELTESNEKYRKLSEELEERVKQRTIEVQDLYENAPIGYHSLNAQGNIITINQTELNWLGYTHTELVGKPFAHLFTPDSLSTFQANFPVFKQRGWVRDLEFDLIRKDGSTFPVLVNATTIKDESGNFVMSRTTVFDNSERKESEKKLHESYTQLDIANRELKRASRAKDEFIANMSHELRTPLNAIIGLSESMLEISANDFTPKQQKYLSTIRESGQHLLNLINDILDLAKVGAGKLTLEPNTIDMDSICQSSLRMVKQLANKKNIDVQFDMDEDIDTIYTDPRRLKQMIVNLLTNAVKFTPPAGKIGLEVRGDRVNHLVRFTVWDTGIGISKEDQAHLFQPFEQVNSSTVREVGGTGLGLALVAEMAHLHGGTVSLESEPGKGSRFSFTINWFDQATSGASSPKTGSAGKLTSPAITINSGKKHTILLIEDTETIVMFVRDYLEAKGYLVEVAQNGQDGIEMAHQIKPDLILMDVQMPVMDGLEATRRLRTQIEFQNTPIIAVTAYAMNDDRDRCLNAGATDYLSKPYEIKFLGQKIENLLKEKNQTASDKPHPPSKHSK